MLVCKYKRQTFEHENPQPASITFPDVTMSYSDAVGHRPMLFDSIRNSAYAGALEKVIGPDTTVMDLGAGLGVHGLFAARLGARKVYLVDPSPVLEISRRVARDNGLEQVECLQATAEELSLDARVDVITSVFTGNFLLTEDLLPSLFYARDHFLAPGGCLIPDRGRMEVVPVSAPAYYHKHVGAWAEYPEHCAEHGLPSIDYSRVAASAANNVFHDKAEKFAATHLAAPHTLLELDFNTAVKAECDQGVDFRMQRDGTCHGWVGWFQIRLANEWLCSDGLKSETHWKQVFLPLAQPITVERGDTVAFHLKRPEGGEWTWDTTHRGERQRHSTFLSRALKPADLLKKSGKYQPKLNAKGRAARWLLERLNGTTAVAELARQLCGEFPDLFHDQNSAQRFIFSLTDQLS